MQQIAQPTFLKKTGLPERDIPRFLALIEELIGVPYEFSPESTSRQLLLSLHNRPGGKRLEMAEMPPPALIPNLETDLMWIRPLTAEEQAAPFIVAYDVNAAYLAACSSLALGVGAPTHYDNIEFGWDLPGYVLWPDGTWRTMIGARRWREIRYGADLPGCEAWLWRDTSRPLEPWYKVLRDARESLMIRVFGLSGNEPVVRAALGCIKQMYTGFIGRLCATGWDRTGDVLYRPDWRHMIIATRRTRLQRVMAQTDPAPFAAYSDCLYFATEQQVTGLKIGTNPGAFKIHGTERNEGDVRTAVDAGDLHQLVRLVK